MIIEKPEGFYVPREGVFAEVPEVDYHSLSAVSNSLLSQLYASPAHAHYAMTSEGTRSKNLAFGSAFHMAVLEPDLFDTRFVEAEQCSAQTKAKKQCSKGGSVRINDKWYCEIHKTEEPPDQIEIISETELGHLKEMRSNLFKNNFLREHLLESVGLREVSLIWNDQRLKNTGLFCKGRIDYLSDDSEIMIDLKTTQSADAFSFAKSIYNYGYHRQAAWYRQAVRYFGGNLKKIYLVAVEKTPPYCFKVYELKESDIELGWKQLQPLVKQFNTCFKNDHWPGYGDEVEVIGLPDWGVQAIENELVSETTAQPHGLTERDFEPIGPRSQILRKGSNLDKDTI